MSGGDVYEVRMRVKSGPKSGAIGNSSVVIINNNDDRPCVHGVTAYIWN